RGGGDAGLVASERERHREARRMRRAQDLLGVGALAVAFEAAREPIRVALQCTGLGADLADTLLALAFPMNAGGSLDHDGSFQCDADERPVSIRRRHAAVSSDG